VSRFASIKSERAKPPAAIEPEEASSASPTPARALARIGKKAISGYFSPEVSRGLHMLGLEQGLSLQALMGEAFDDLMRKYGKHPFGER
jgi:hypothetical protein